MTYLPQDKVIFDNLLNLFIGPYVPVEDLAGKLLRILDINEQPTVQILSVIACFHEGTQKEDIAWWSEQIFQTLGFLLGDVFHARHSTGHFFFLTLCTKSSVNAMTIITDVPDVRDDTYEFPRRSL